MNSNIEPGEQSSYLSDINKNNPIDPAGALVQPPKTATTAAGSSSVSVVSPTKQVCPVK